MAKKVVQISVGYHVIITCAHREQELLKTRREIEGYQVSCTPFLGDAGDLEDCRKLFGIIGKQYGSLDVLVNNAGIYISVPRPGTGLSAPT